MGKLILIFGIVLVIVGLLVMYVRIPFLGKLPGDIFIQGKNVQFYFPIVTSILISIVLSVLLSLFFYFFSGK